LGESHENNGANERAQMLKYHIQTSTFFTHKKLISMIFVRLCKRCMRFMTTVIRCIPMHMMKQLRPYRRKVRRAMIQLIINKELGLAKMKTQGALSSKN
jgi:methylmalonyl-CoA mutase